MAYCQSSPSFALAYFYFDFRDIGKQHDSLICSLVTQLSAQCACCPNSLNALYSQCGDGNRQPATNAIMTALLHIVESFQQTFIILDALDECADRDALLEVIIEMANWKLDKLHILVTSRKERDIEDHLQPQISAQINLQSTLVAGDIQIHIHERLQNDSRLKRWPEEVKKEIEETLVDGACGM